MKNILVPCDFSKPALEAVRFASHIARKSKGQITLFHAIPLPVLYNESVVLEFEADYMKETKASALKRLQAINDKLTKGVRTRIVVEFGDLLHQFKQLVKSRKYDLVVMGTHGASGLKEFTIGSNAEKIVRNSDVPVIALRKAAHKVKNIVFPVVPDVSQNKLVNKVKDLQKFFGAALHIVFVNTPIVFRREIETVPQLQKFVKKFQLKNCTVNTFADMTEEAGIINFRKFVDGDIVVMRTHGRKGLAYLANVSIAENVVNHIECPIWTYKVK